MSGGKTLDLSGEELSAAVRERMLRHLPDWHDVPELRRFYELQRDYPSRVGKTLRGRVLVLSAATHGADELDTALTVAAAIELFQAWVLVHDDIEDESEERRGSPALHRLVGVPIALNVGDALHAHMWGLLHTLLEEPPAATTQQAADRSRLARSVFDEFGAMVTKTAMGQHLDLAWVEEGRFDVTEDEYRRMVTLKTAWYTVASPLRLGAMVAGVEPDPRLTDAGLDLGAAFQIRDDLLNLATDGSVPDYGKEALGDLFEAKRTLILTHLLGALSRSDAAAVTRRLALPRSERTLADARWVRELMESNGSLDHAQGVADRLTESGLGTLREALSRAASPKAAEVLIGELAAVADRRS